MSIAALIASFGRPLTVTRYAAGAYDSNGAYQPGATSTINIIMSVQPLNGRELILLPEGERTKQYVRGYTNTQLYTAQQAASKKADQTSIDGVTFEVQKVEKWEATNMNIQPYWKIVMAEVNP
jgi:hypothetical protein